MLRMISYKTLLLEHRAVCLPPQTVEVHAESASVLASVLSENNWPLPPCPHENVTSPVFVQPNPGHRIPKRKCGHGLNCTGAKRMGPRLVERAQHMGSKIGPGHSLPQRFYGIDGRLGHAGLGQDPHG